MNDAWFKKPEAMTTALDVPDAFDEALLALHQLGGKLKDAEMRRLEHFGLVGDARQTLRQRKLWE